MNYTIDGLDDDDDGHECVIVSGNGTDNYTIKIDGHEHSLRILSADSTGIDFILDNSHHHATYLAGGALETRMILDGLDMSVMQHTGLDKIVYMNSGKTNEGSNKDSLPSPIPGKVISVAVSDGDEIKKDDPVCVLEAMKMQVTVKAHKTGTIKSLNISTDNVIAKGFLIAEIS